MKTKLILFLAVIFLSNQSFAIGLPHGLGKKKKVENVDNSKKENKLEKKIMFLGKSVTYFVQKVVEFQSK